MSTLKDKSDNDLAVREGILKEIIREFESKNDSRIEEPKRQLAVIQAEIAKRKKKKKKKKIGAEPHAPVEIDPETGNPPPVVVKVDTLNLTARKKGLG